MTDIKGDKYIYLSMAYKLAKDNGGHIVIGKDNGYTGGQHYYRTFEILQYNNKTILIERKNSSGFVSMSRAYHIMDRGDDYRLSILELIENGDNHSKNWNS